MALPELQDGFAWRVKRVDGNKEALEVYLIEVNKYGNGRKLGSREVNTSGVGYWDPRSESRLVEAVDDAANAIMASIERDAYLDHFVEEHWPCPR